MVIPCHNESAVLPETYRRLTEVEDRLENEGDFELIFVDDGSKDETARGLRPSRSRALPGWRRS